MTLAIIAMLSVSAFVVPMLIRASNTNELRSVNPVTTEDGRSAGEHVLWSLQNDPTFLSGFTGDPPTHSYQVTAGNLNADVVVTTTNYAAPSETLDLMMTLDPPVIPVNQWTEVTFELEVFNNSEVDQEIDAVEVYPQGAIAANFVSGSSSGFESSDPISVSGGWRWNVWPYKTIGALGESETHTWMLDVNAGENNYWFDALIHTAGGETIHVPIETTVKVSNDVDDLSVTSKTVPRVVEADTPKTFDVQIIMENSTSPKERVRRIRHIMPSALSYVSGSAEGVTTSDPTAVSGQGPRGDMTVLTWDLSPFDLEEDKPQQLVFQVAGSLPIGEYISQSSFRVNGEGAGSAHYSASSGQYHAISASRTYDISVTQGDFSMEIETWLVSSDPVITQVREK